MEPLRVAPATPADVTELAAVAAETFPLACPASVTAENIAAFLSENLSADKFAHYLADAARAVLVARDDTRILGYAMLIRGAPTDTDVARVLPRHPVVELSKIYVLPDHHGAGVAAALMNAAVGRAATTGARCIWLGVNQNNQRAQRFYGKHGFTVAGTKTFAVGAHLENDFVMARALVYAV